jgi:hypothetical protein
MSVNIYILAADDPSALTAHLRENPSVASSQDEHGYSLVHAAASYNHLDLLRALVSEFHVPIDLKDEDGETALFVVETVAAAKVLVEELGLDASITNDEGLTAKEKMESDDEFPAIVEYLQTVGSTASGSVNGTTNGDSSATTDLPPVPEGLQVSFGSMSEQDAGSQEPDPEFRRRLEELAAREDFQTPEGQEELRRLVEQAVTGEGLAEERNVRTRQE